MPEPTIPNQIRRALLDLKSAKGEAATPLLPEGCILGLESVEIEALENDYDKLTAQLFSIVSGRADASKNILLENGVLRMHEGLRSRLLRDLERKVSAAIEFDQSWTNAERFIQKRMLEERHRFRRTAEMMEMD